MQSNFSRIFYRCCEGSLQDISFGSSVCSTSGISTEKSGVLATRVVVATWVVVAA